MSRNWFIGLAALTVLAGLAAQAEEPKSEPKPTPPARRLSKDEIKELHLWALRTDRFGNIWKIYIGGYAPEMVKPDDPLFGALVKPNDNTLRLSPNVPPSQIRQILPPNQPLAGETAKNVHVTITTTAALPDGFSVEIVQTDREPATITLTRGNEKWVVNEAEINKLPEQVRSEVRRLIPHKVTGQIMEITPDTGK